MLITSYFTRLGRIPRYRRISRGLGGWKHSQTRQLFQKWHDMFRQHRIDGRDPCRFSLDSFLLFNLLNILDLKFLLYLFIIFQRVLIHRNIVNWHLIHSRRHSLMASNPRSFSTSASSATLRYGYLSRSIDGSYKPNIDIPSINHLQIEEWKKLDTNLNR